jgi:demethylmenaquinone methyltransferase/2-methoxy-6-polyprenyl-1,4-benzoquinol methylase
MQADPRQAALVDRFFCGTGSSYDFVVNFLTFGADLYWKKKILTKILPVPQRVIDQACGTGILTMKIAGKFPGCRVIGVELREEYLNLARHKAARLNLNNIDFVLGRAEDVVPAADVDCITSSYLAKYAELSPLIQHAYEMLRRGGCLVLHDFIHPTGCLFAALWSLYFRLLQTAGSWKYPQWRTVFFELPQLLAESRWLRELQCCLQEVGFAQIRIETLTLGAAAMVTATKP